MPIKFNTNKLILFYRRKRIQMLVHISSNLRRNQLFLFHILFFQIVERLILLIHGHELIFGTVSLQIGPVRIVNFLGLINQF